ncbi:MAG TPA: glycosyltransferase [Trichocoleus sp.]
MTHFGVICPPYSGHINPQASLARELQARGHRVTFLQLPDLEEKIRSAGVGFCPIGTTLYKPGSLAEMFEQLAKLNGIESLQYSVEFCRHMAEIVCQDAPDAIAREGIEVIICDQLEPVGETIAESLNLPFICVSCGQAIHRRADVPPFFMPWPYENTLGARVRNQVAYYILDRSCRPILQEINRYRRRCNLPPYRRIYQSNTRLAHISQQPPAFDFPLSDLPTHFHYVGPLRTPNPQTVSFPFDRLNGKPLIYASLGSIQNTKKDVFYCIAAACEDLDAQLVMTLGGGIPIDALPNLPGSPLLVDYAPQTEILSRASLTITHGGMNTVLDSLSYGVPMVALPITFEQPGTGARIRWTGVGEVIPIDQVNTANLKAAVEQVFTEQSYRQNAKRIQQSIAEAGGASRAAEVIEQALQSNYPVESPTLVGATM